MEERMLDGSVWVTGAAGFIGRAIVRRLRAAGRGVVGLGHAPEGSLEREDPLFVPGDIDPDIVAWAVRRFGAPSGVVHAAGGSSVAAGQAAPLGDFQRTVATTASLLHTLGRLAPGTRIVLPSSAAVYGNTTSTPITEDTVCEPVSQYGWHKLLAEQICRQAVDAYELPCVIVRFFSVYGPGLRKQVLWDVGLRLLTTSGAVDIDATGEETRDFLHVEDAVGLTVSLLERDMPPCFVVNGGTGRAVRLADLLGLLGNALGAEGRVRYTGTIRPGNPPHLRADTDRLAGLGFAPRWSLEDGVAGYARWLRDELRGDPQRRGTILP